MARGSSLDGRLYLQNLLEGILGSKHVYFQPPESMKLEYPCFIYRRGHNDVHHADNTAYKKDMQYEILLVDADPDSIYLDKILSIPRVRHNRHYASDNLNHDAFTIYI